MTDTSNDCIDAWVKWTSEYEVRGVEKSRVPKDAFFAAWSVQEDFIAGLKHIINNRDEPREIRLNDSALREEIRGAIHRTHNGELRNIDEVTDSVMDYIQPYLKREIGGAELTETPITDILANTLRSVVDFLKQYEGKFIENGFDPFGYQVGKSESALSKIEDEAIK